MYKAVIELSTDRADFLSRLFSRPRPVEVGKDTSVEALFDAFRPAEPDAMLLSENHGAIKEKLIQEHGFTLSEEDEAALLYVMRAFYLGGQMLTYSGPTQTLRPGLNRIMPAYEQLMTDTDEQGQFKSFLATEENFRTLQELEKNNLIVPLVGNFAGVTAIRSVGDYLKEHNTTVNAFYTSNVEQYLFMNSDEWRSFYRNVSALPLDSKSVFIRPLINTGAGYDASPVFRVGFQWDTVLFPIQALLEAFEGGKIQTYYDVIK
jgi:hypothetical protein